MTVYREACRDCDLFRQERDAARLAAEAASRLKEELDTIKRQRDDLQAQLVDSELQRAGSQARLEVLQRSKGLKHIESGPGAASPSQSGVPAAPAASPQRAVHAIPGIGTVGVRPLGHAAHGRRQVVVPSAADHCGATSNNHDAGPERGQPTEG